MIVSAFSFFGSVALFKITDLLIPLRVTEEQEVVGLDLSQHGEMALCHRLIGREVPENLTPSRPEVVESAGSRLGGRALAKPG